MTDPSRSTSQTSIAVVIPCFRVRAHIDSVLSQVGPEVAAVYVVDDACPEQTGHHVESTCRDPRVRVLRNSQNLGVGGAVIAGYHAALAGGADIVVKVDGDGQMDPSLIPLFVAPILTGEADYTKGNRFFDPESLIGMPTSRIAGNAVLSLMTKLSTGYWRTFDPTNGYTAISSSVAKRIPFKKVSERYFFETDMLFRLSALGAVVVDVPMASVYGTERSGLSIPMIVPEFLRRHATNTLKRLAYRYFIRDFSIASLELVVGLALLVFGFTFGVFRWYQSLTGEGAATAGTVMLAALPFLAGLQLLIAFLNYDIFSTPVQPLSRSLGERAQVEGALAAGR